MFVDASEIPGVGYTAFSSPMGVHIPTGGRVVAYVRATGAQAQDPVDIRDKVVPDLNTALGRCRSGYGDVVIVMNGHTENVATADSMDALVAGTKIIGLGTANDRPIFTWTTAASTFLLDVANVTLDNLIFEMAGPAGAVALTVAAPMTISAAGCTISRCKLHTEIDADQASTIAVTTTAAADDLTVSNCYWYGSGDGTLPTTMLQLVGADRFKMFNCIMDGYTSSVNVGLMRFITTASYGIHVEKCTFNFRLAASVSPVVGHANDTGTVVDCNFCKLADDDLTMALAWVTATAIQFVGARVCNLAAENAGVGTVVST